ncbi:DUF6461 domain-containing protein [Streptomyces sp. GC420]|uniref:DUF6461 domain-containing protein n=1 Tax=Streptomyces sp. GC420 TaxID=2697568 RepID=UPI0014151DA5|nr:DUF6461 domain-containing protein [Streptomyces sp. GC420]NBM16207.1 hypothetical protein [Streptomyces sp. GC420]
MTGQGGDFSWVAELEQDYIVPTVCLIEGVDPDEVIRRLGADPATARSMTVRETVDLAASGEREFVGVGRTAGISCTVESIGYVTAVPGVLRDLSRGGRAFSVRFDVNGADSVHYAVDGDLVVYAEPYGAVESLRPGDPRWDVAWSEGLFNEEGQWGPNILALAESVMGAPVPPSLFTEPLATVELPSAARYAGTFHWDIP